VLESKDAEIERLRAALEGSHGVAGAVAFAVGVGRKGRKARRGKKGSKEGRALKDPEANDGDVVEVDDVMLGALLDGVEARTEGEGTLATMCVAGKGRGGRYACNNVPWLGGQTARHALSYP
jgi:hypothetical protein